MIKYLFILISGAALQCLNAQVYQSAMSTTNANTINITNFRQGGQFIVDAMGLPDNVEGSVYLEEGYHPAVVSMLSSEQPPLKAFFTYDVFNNIMLMSENSDGSGAFTLSQAANIVVSFDKYKFRFLDYTIKGESYSTYVDIISNLDKDHILGLVRTKRIFEDNSPVSSYSNAKVPRMKMDSQYILIDKDGVALPFENNKRGILKNVEDSYQNQLKDYIKTNNIKFEADQEGLVAVASYYVSIKN